jgi:drug/metabolite transporter (DMT)-like permease
MGFVFLLYALFASVFTIAKTGLEYAHPFFLVGTRMMAAGLLLLAYQYLFDRSQFRFKAVHFWKLLQLSLFNIYLTNAFEFWGLQYLTSFKTCFIYSLSPFISALISYMVFSEKLSMKKWCGLLVGFLGFIPILVTHTQSEASMGSLFLFSWPELSVMLAAICSVYGWILLKQLVHEEGYTPMIVNGLSMLIGGGISLVHSGIVEPWDPIPVTEILPFLQCNVLLIVISNLICYNLYGALLKRYSATFMSFAGSMTPLFTALFGRLFLNEVVAWPFYLSATIVFMGLLAFYQEELRRDYSPEKVV